LCIAALCYAHTCHRALHSFPTRRSSDLLPEDVGMRVGVAAHDMATAVEVADLPFGEKGPRADETGDDEEMPLPAAGGQRVADRDGALSAVVEREQHMPTGPGEIDIGDALRQARTRGDRIQVPRERRAGVLVRQRPRALEAGGG